MPAPQWRGDLSSKRRERAKLAVLYKIFRASYRFVQNYLV
jgi:hypothetical protein